MIPTLRSRAAALLCAMVGLSGCYLAHGEGDPPGPGPTPTRVGTLTVQIELTRTARYLLVQLGDPETWPLDVEWSTGVERPHALRLGDGFPCFRTRGAPELSVNMHARLCEDLDCADIGTRSELLEVHIERPFYTARNTLARTFFVEGRRETARCEVEGCVLSSGGVSDYCRASGEHFCETEADVELATACTSVEDVPLVP